MFTYFDKHDRRLWVEFQLHTDWEFGSTIDEIEVWLERDGVRRLCTKYVPNDVFKAIETEVWNHVPTI